MITDSIFINLHALDCYSFFYEWKWQDTTVDCCNPSSTSVMPERVYCIHTFDFKNELKDMEKYKNVGFMFHMAIRELVFSQKIT